MILYHVTNVRNVPGILRHGLRPSRRKGFSGKVDVDPQLKAGRYLYFVDDLRGVGDLLTALAAYQYSPVRLAVLEVEVPEDYPYMLESDVDPNASGIFTEFLVSSEPVPPGSIRVLGTVKSGYQRGGTWGLLPTALPTKVDIPEEAMGQIEFGSRGALFSSEYHGGPVPEEFKEPIPEKKYPAKKGPEYFGIVPEEY